jgi:hypothetical protein
LLRHSNLSLTKLKQLDTYLIKLINRGVEESTLTKETFYLRVGDGGFDIYALQDRYHIFKMAKLGHPLSRSIGKTMPRYILQVVLDKNVSTVSDIDQIPSNRFFSWVTDRNSEIDQMGELLTSKFLKHSSYVRALG